MIIEIDTSEDLVGLNSWPAIVIFTPRFSAGLGSEVAVFAEWLAKRYAAAVIYSPPR
jgi:hypothetical protein